MESACEVLPASTVLHLARCVYGHWRGKPKDNNGIASGTKRWHRTRKRASTGHTMWPVRRNGGPSEKGGQDCSHQRSSIDPRRKWDRQGSARAIHSCKLSVLLGTFHQGILRR